MNGNCTASTYAEPPFIYGQILQRSLYLAQLEKQDQPGIGRYVSQGAAAGAISFFVYLIMGLLSVDAYYSILFPRALPEFLGWGIGIGMYMGLLIWACARLTNRRLGKVSRALLSICGYLIFLAGLQLVYPRQSQEHRQLDWKLFLSILLPSLLMGLVIGSRLQPWRAFVRGRESGSFTAALIARTSGFVLRLATVFFLMEFVLILIVAILWHSKWRDIGYTLLGLAHCLFSFMIVFSKLKFTWLSLLAFVVNVPVILLFSKLRIDDWVARYVIFGYLIAWASFLLSRSTLVDSALAIVDEEIRYYLID